MERARSYWFVEGDHLEELRHNLIFFNFVFKFKKKNKNKLSCFFKIISPLHFSRAITWLEERLFEGDKLKANPNLLPLCVSFFF